MSILNILDNVSNKNKVLAGCICVMSIMATFPPQVISSYYSPTNNLMSEEIEYHFIGGGDLRHNERSSIAYDRLLLQWIIVAGIGFTINLLIARK